VSRYLTGILLLAIALVPLHTASYLWRARLVAEWRGAQARLVEIIMDVTVVICVSEILGSVQLYSVAPVVIALGTIGLAAIWAARRTTWGRSEDPSPLPQPTQPSGPRWANAVAIVAVSVVVAEWSTQIVAAYHHGMLSTDTLWYHMPFAARFVQDHSITPLHFFDSQAVTVFFPASSELFHSLGILLMGNDVLSPLINLLWLGLALLASWCLGRPFGVAPITLTGSAILFATPGLVATQPGGAYDDVVGLALIVSSAALLLNSQALSGLSQSAAWVMAAAALGLAMGVKWTFLGPGVALTVGFAFFVTRGKRARSLGVWLVVLLLAGSFWYWRNFVAVGNPVPPLHLGLGPLSLPSPQVNTFSATTAQFLFDTADWHEYFLPGLRLSFGPAWWALLGLSAVGLVLAVVKGDRLQRILGLVGLASGVFFLFTPQYVAPHQFAENARYADPAVILGLVLLPINPMLTMWRRARLVLLAYTAILVATQFDAGIWPTNFFSQRFVGGPVRGSDSLLGLLIGVAVLIAGMVLFFERRRLVRRRNLTIAWIVVAAILIVAGFPLQQTYLRDRYVGSAGSQSSFVNWFQHKNNIRVGVIGQFSYLQYPLYGRTLSNYVQYLGIRGPHGTYSAFASCKDWREVIDSGRYSYILITTNEVSTRAALSSAQVPEMKWMASGGDSSVILTGQQIIGPPLPGYLGYTLYKTGSHLSCTK
jgi:hypothetical protein